MSHENYILFLQVVIILGCGILTYLIISTGLLKKIYEVFSSGISFFLHWACFIFRKPMTIFYFTLLQGKVVLATIPHIWRTRTGLINFLIRLVFLILVIAPSAFIINPFGFLSIYSYLLFSVLSDGLIGAVFSSRALLFCPILLGKLFSLIYIYVTDMDEFIWFAGGSNTAILWSSENIYSCLNDKNAYHIIKEDLEKLCLLS